MWLVWMIALVLIVIGAVLWMHRLDNIPPAPPYSGGGIATDGSDEDGKHHQEEAE